MGFISAYESLEHNTSRMLKERGRVVNRFVLGDGARRCSKDGFNEETYSERKSWRVVLGRRCNNKFVIVVG